MIKSNPKGEIFVSRTQIFWKEEKRNAVPAKAGMELLTENAGPENKRG